MTLRKSRVIDFDAVLRRERARSAALRKSEAHRRKKETSRRLSASLTPDRWFCERCNKWHPKIEECPTIKPVVDRIENRLGRAFGQSDKYSGSILAALALDINIWARHSHSIAKIRKRYLRHPELGPYLRREHIIPYEIIPIERSPPTLTAEQAGLAYNHWLVVRKLAGQFAPDNKALRDNLEAHGLEELVNLIRRYDPARGVAFGAFAKPHLAKAMREYVRDYHRTTVPISPELIDWAMGDRTRKRTANVKYEEREGRTNFDRQRDEIAKLSRDRDRSCWQREQADKATKEFVEAGGVIRNSNPTIGEELESALAKLNSRQREVYRGRVLTFPPKTREELACRLGIRDATQISRIQRQAERKVAMILTRKVSSPHRILISEKVAQRKGRKNEN